MQAKPNPRYFFWSGNGNPKSVVADWQRSYRRLFKLADIRTPDGEVKRCHPHMFRDTFAVETCLHLMGKKMLVALMMEGKFSGEGLQALDTDEDLMSAMARELVEKAGVGESADAVWRELDGEREKVQPHAAEMEPDLKQEPVDEFDLPISAAEPPIPTPFGISLVEPNAAAKKRKKTTHWPTATETNVQLSLFD